MTTYKVLAIHGIGGQEANKQAWQSTWAAAIGQRVRQFDPGAAVIVDYFDYDQLFEDADPDIGDYTEAFLRLAGSTVKHSVIDFFTGLFGRRRGIGQVISTIDWTAGMVAQFAADSRLRQRLRAKLAADSAACFAGSSAGTVNVLAAHSLGSLLTYDTLTQLPNVAAGAHLLTFGSQIGHRALRDIFNGRLVLPPQIKQWHHLYNPNDKVFTAPISIARPGFRQYDATFTVDKVAHAGFTTHSAELYFHDDGADAAWAAIAAEATLAAGTAHTRAFNQTSKALINTARPASTARPKALLVGVDRYQDPNNNLSGCVNDVYRMSEVLQELGFDVSDIRLLVNERATAAAMRDRLAWLLQDAGDCAERVLFFSGHGVQVPAYGPSDQVDHLDECLAPHDADFGDESTLVRDDQIFEMYSQLPYEAQVYFIFDCCHAGGMARAVPAGSAGGGRGSARARFLELPDDVRHRMMRWDGQRWVPRRLGLAFKDLAKKEDRQTQFGSSEALHRFGRPVSVWSKLSNKSAPVKSPKVEKGGDKQVDVNHGPFQPVLFYACQEHEEAREYNHGSITFGGFTFALTSAFRRLSSNGVPTYSALLAEVTQELRTLGLTQTPWIDGPSVKLNDKGKLDKHIFGCVAENNGQTPPKQRVKKPQPKTKPRRPTKPQRPTKLKRSTI